ncbi:hypothetical protein ACIBCT_22950 [Streptosporangium sp. NPDC050855]|uniref:hypothetical protein n=1 Tax=Streptosporangium sp. NPDC050855 TaxID=3366194 RepID=UPI0037A6B4D1
MSPPVVTALRTQSRSRARRRSCTSSGSRSSAAYTLLTGDQAGQENFCHSFPTLTYGGTDREDGSTTLGGYSREYVVREAFAYPLPSGLDPAAAAPLLCAGVTVWEPLRSLGVGPGSRVAVAGPGGLGRQRHRHRRRGVPLLAGAHDTRPPRAQRRPLPLRA